MTDRKPAEYNEVRLNGGVVKRIFHAEAHGVDLSWTTDDLEIELYVSPIWTMREKGVALVDSRGMMVKNERRLR